MTDGRNYWRMEFFAHRVMTLPNHPTLLVLNSGIEVIRRKTGGLFDRPRHGGLARGWPLHGGEESFVSRHQE